MSRQEKNARVNVRAPAWRRVATVALLVSVSASVGLYATQRDHIHHHNERVLQQLAASQGIHVTFHTKTQALNATAWLFPRTDALESIDARLTYTMLGHEYNFTVVGGRGYTTVEDIASRKIVRNECLQRGSIPPVDRLIDALREARVVDGSETHHVVCDDGKLVEFRFAGEPYVFCSRANGIIDKIHGNDLEATVEMIPANTVGTAHTVESLRRPGFEALEACDLLDRTSVQSENTTGAGLTRVLTNAVARARDIATVMTGRRRLADSDDCSTTCKDGKKICLFVHGLGKSLDAPVADTYDDAWGEAAWEDMACCSQTKFVRMDTVSYPWYTALLANKVCDAAVALTGSKDPMQLDNIAIISHSMGNLIVASAAAKGICAVGPSSKWIALAGPISGSRSANLGTSTCSSETPPIEALNETVLETLTAVNLCPAKRGTQSLVYKASEQSFAELDLLYEHAIDEFRKRVTASLCGVSSVGLASLRSAKYAALGLISRHGSPHDGAVEIDSCASAFGVDAYQTSWRGGRFYRASVNHADAALRNGDGLWGEDRKPVKWLNCQF